MDIIGKRVGLKPNLSMKAIGQVFGFRREMIVKGVPNSRFHMTHGLLKVRGSRLALGIIMISLIRWNLQDGPTFW